MGHWNRLNEEEDAFGTAQPLESINPHSFLVSREFFRGDDQFNDAPDSYANINPVGAMPAFDTAVTSIPKIPPRNVRRLADEEIDTKKKDPSSCSIGGTVERLLKEFGELTTREEQKKLQYRPRRTDLHGLTIDHEFPLVKGKGVPQGWLRNEPCFLDTSKCIIKEPPLLCEGGIRIDWHYEEMMKPQKQVAIAVARAVKLGKHAILEAPTGTGKTAALLCSALAAQRYLSIKTGACPQILYGTRTHGQVTQVVNEIRNCPFRPSVGVLGSRDKGLCINKNVKNIASSKKVDLKTMCLEARKNAVKVQNQNDAGNKTKVDKGVPVCKRGVTGLDPPFAGRIFPMLRPMYDNRVEDLTKSILDLEDLATMTGGHGGCPYFLSQINAATAQIVICPYNYILDPKTAKRTRVEVTNRIIILDEAHNIEQVCRDAGSTEISYHDLLDGFESALSNVTVHLKIMLGGTKTVQVETSSSVATMHATRELISQVQNFFDRIRLKMEGWLKTYTRQVNLSDEANRHNYDKRHRWEVHVWSPQKATIGHFADSVGWKAQSAIPTSGDITDPAKVGMAIDALKKSLASKAAGASENILHDEGASQSTLPETLVTKLNHALELLEEAAGFFAMMFANMNSYAVTFSVAQPKADLEGPQAFINLYLLSPKVIFEEIAASSHSIIVASGTLCPVESFFSELGQSFAQNQITGKYAGQALSPLEADHVINPNQIFLQKLSTVQMQPGIDMRFCSKLKEIKSDGMWNEDLLCALGRSIVQLIQAVPEGVLVFLPNYRMLSKLEILWQHDRSRRGTGAFHYPNTIWDALIAAKGAIVVEESSRDIEELKHEYLNHIKERRQCLLLGVLRAKCSEGISFNDENSRAVIVVGISYPEMMSAEVRLKMEYNDFLKKRNETTLGGHDWYTQQAFRATNQALGRCIRHRGDYGALFVIDARWSEEIGTEQKLAVWLRQLGLRPTLPIDQVVPQLKEHFRLLQNKRSIEPQTGVCNCKKSSLFGSSLCPVHRYG